MSVRRWSAVVGTVLLSVAVFSFVFSFLRNGYQVNRHGAAAVFIVFMLPLALGELAFLFFIPGIYLRSQRRGRLGVTFFLISGIHLLVFSAAMGGQIIMYQRIFGVDRSLALGLVGRHNDGIALGALALGLACMGLAGVAAHRRARSLGGRRGANGGGASGSESPGDGSQSRME